MTETLEKKRTIFPEICEKAKKRQGQSYRKGKYTRATSYGNAAYVKYISFSKKTEKIANEKNLELDLERIQEEVKYDGFYLIVTSELELSDKQIRDIYRALAKIEDTFKVTKSILNTKPVHGWSVSHIKRHFLVWFVALCLIRMLQRKLGDKYSPDQIIEALRKYRCVKMTTNYYTVVHKDPIINEIGDAFGLDMDFKNKTRKNFTAQVKETKLHYKILRN